MLKNQKTKIGKLLKNSTRKLEFPASTLSKGAHIELFSNKSVLIDGCAGVIEYTSEFIKINIGKGSMSFVGNNLQIKFFDDEQLSIDGEISNIEFCI